MRYRAAVSIVVAAVFAATIAAAADDPHAARAAYEQLLGSVGSSDAPATDLAGFLALAAGTEWELPGRIVAAEAAYRRGHLDTAYRALRDVDLAAGDAYLGAYGLYVLGLVGPEDESHGRFTAAYERAGDTLLRHRAGLWLADAVARQGAGPAAVALLETLAQAPIGDELRADAIVRQALLRETLGDAEAARSLLRELWIEHPELGYARDTRDLFSLVEARVTAASLAPEQRSRRIERLLATGHAGAARTEARELVKAGKAGRDRARFLLARAELRSRSPRRALTQLDKIPSSSPLYYQARLLRAKAQIRLGNKRTGEAAMAKLAASEQAGAVRAEAAAALAERLQRRDGERAIGLWTTVALSSPPGEQADLGMWKVGWHRWEIGDYESALHWFGRQMSDSPEPIHVARGAYWAARSLERLARPDDARLLYREAHAADRLGYYGLAAASRLRALEPAAAWGAPSLHGPTTAPDPLSDSPSEVLAALQPARKLLLLGLYEDALAELDYQCRRFPSEPAPRALVAEIHHARGDYQSSVIWLKRAFPELGRGGLPESYWTRLYPLSHWDTIQKHAGGAGLDPYLAAAVIYQESRFRANAVSRAGARGLMQIMPLTGRDIARSLRERGYQKSQLFEPERNVRYGIHYLAGLLQRYEGSVTRALAAYNAGSGRVRKWSDGRPLESDEFIERIPFRETRLYVKKILVAHAGYHQVYDGTGECALTR